MNAQDVLSHTLDTSSMVLSKYIEDLTDAELMSRPGPGCNHIAWQLGHLVASQCGLLNSVCPGTAPELPAGFAEKHDKATVGDDDANNFSSKQEYLDLFESVNSAAKTELSKLSEADLDKPGPEHMQPMFPTVGSIFVLIATHQMMHAGQFVPVRRALGKPVVI